MQLTAKPYERSELGLRVWCHDKSKLHKNLDKIVSSNEKRPLMESFKMVGMTRFERATPSSQARCSTKLSHIPVTFSEEKVTKKTFHILVFCWITKSSFYIYFSIDVSSVWFNLTRQTSVRFVSHIPFFLSLYLTKLIVKILGERVNR